MHIRSLLSAFAFLIGAVAVPAMAQIVPPGATPTKLTPNFTFTESPLYDGNGGVYFSDLGPSGSPATNPSHIERYDIASGITTVADPASGGTNGTYYNANHQIVSADRERRQLSLRSAADITVVQQVLASQWNGINFNGPNDLVIDAAGGIYFTDPDYENRHTQPDAVYYLNPQGVLSQLLSYSGATHRPNGVILSPDGRTLYLALDIEKRIMAYNVAPDGSISNERQFATMGPTNNPDGLTIDPAGNVYAAGNRSVWAWNPAGQKLFQLAMPVISPATTAEDPTNVEFGGADGKTLFIAAGRALYGVHLNIATPVTGDYNGDGAVNAADYTVWRDSVGSTTNFAADGTGDHVIDQADYDWWVSKFPAAGAGVGSIVQGNTVPEPSTIALAAVATLLLCFLPTLIARN